MDLADCVLIRLDPDETSIASFDCGDTDLNNFLLNDAANYLKARLSVTHILTLPIGDTVQITGYFCLLTDKLAFDPSDNEQKKVWLYFNKKHKIHFNKNRKTYPAVKIGRLAVASVFAGKGLGRLMIANAIALVVKMGDIGCRFITVDAYRDAFDFYLKNHFDFLSDDDVNEKTRLMYLDIKRLYP
ncbi:MAG: GNAT family N-acetyltransferase [Dysgonamonadaceae bacterium]|jgi:GNAT superfamily N-acetyltransferase|nr:GNAT family N-acetyltransferase [Dysgonamonadaceae bacterium]